MKTAAIFLSFLVLVTASPEGAPDDACADMVPQHFVDPQTGPSPFRLTATADGGGAYTVVIDGDVPIKGYLVRAEDTTNDNIVGEFTDFGSDGKARPCPPNSGTDNGATHTDRMEIDSVTLKFQLDGGVDPSNVKFFASVVQDTVTFWVRLESDALGNL